MYMSDVGICCDYKRKLFTHKNALFDSLKITPRLVIFEKYKANRKYKRTVQIENDHMYPRNIFFENNFPDGLKMVSPQQKTLQSGEMISIDVYLEPSNRNRFKHNCYSLFICSIHPSVTVEIPVFLQPNPAEIWFPLCVKMQDSSPGVHCYYSFPIYNPTANEATCLIRVDSKRDHLRFTPNSCNLPAKGFSVVNLETVGANMCPVLEELKIFVKCAKNRKKEVRHIQVEAKMVFYVLSVSDFVVRFPCTELGSTSDQCILLCNEIEEAVKFKWCRREKQGEQNESIPSKEDFHDVDHTLPSHVKQINEYFQIKPKSGIYRPISSASALVTFCPPTEVSDDTLGPPYEFRAFAYLACSTNRDKRVRVELVGCAAPPNIEFVDKTIDLGEIAVGQPKQTEAFTKNLGSVAGTLQFVPNDNCCDGTANVSPKEVQIDAKQVHKVNITYRAQSEGKFLEKLTFRVRFGNYLTLFLKGRAFPLTVKVTEEIHFGSIPICVVCTKSVEVFNPFKHSIDVTCSVPEDGTELPLILMIDEEKFVDEISTDKSSEALFDSPDSSSETELETDYDFHEIRNACCRVCALKNLPELSSHSDWDISEKQSVIGEEENQSCACSESTGTGTLRTVLSEESTSSGYGEVLERIPSMASELVSNLKNFQCEMNDKLKEFIVDSTVQNLFKLDYFKRKIEGIDFRKKSWRDLPSNPCEFILNTKKVVLGPMESFVVLVPLVANKHGSRKKNLKLDIVPHNADEDLDEDDKITPSSFSTIVPITYNCVIPTLFLSESIFSLTLYLDCSHYFSFEVKNLDSVGGFFALKTDPFDKNVQLNMKPKKFYIKTNSWQKINGKITVSKIGNIVSSVIIHSLGSKTPQIVRIFADVLSPELNVKPKSATVTQRTLEKKETELYLSNDSPAKARIVVKMADENFTFVEPKEGILDQGQVLIITVTSFFYDPGEYSNTLHIMDSSQSSTSALKVPLKFRVQGFPFEFIPNVRNGLDLNMIAISEKSHRTELNIINHGNNHYNLTIQKTRKPSNQSPGFEIAPHTLNFKPKEEKAALISIKSLNTGTVNEEFCVKVSKGESTKRIHMFCFECNVQFVRVLLKWSSDQLDFNIKNTDMDDGFKFSEKAILTNYSKLASEVSLNTVGPFLMFDTERNEYAKRFNFSLQPKGSKEFEIFFDKKSEINEKISAVYEGKIITKTEKMLQKGLMLTAKMIYPNLNINEHELQFFTKNQQFYAFFTICNTSILPAVYKWQLRSEVEHSLDILQETKMHEQKNLSQDIFSKKCLLLFNDPFENARMKTTSEVLDEVFEKSGARHTENADDKKNTEYLENTKFNNKVNGKSNSGRAEKKKMNTKTVRNPSTNGTLKSKSSRLNRRSIQDSNSVKDTENKITAYQSISRRASLFVTSDDLSQEIDNITIKKSYENDLEVLAPTKHVEESSFIPKNFYLDHYKGHISPGASRVMNVFFVGHSRNSIQKANYDLEVAGGNSASIDLNVYTFDAVVELSQAKFEFGSQPWYELHERKIKLSNKNSFTVKINILENRFLQNNDELQKGFVCVDPGGTFYMLYDATCCLHVKVYLGFCNAFRDGFGVEINNNIPIPVTFEGSAEMPMLTVLDVERPNLGSFNRQVEYFTLNKLFLEKVRDLNYPQSKTEEEQSNKFIELSHGSEHFFQGDESQNELETRKDLLDELLQLKDLVIVQNGSVTRRRNDTKKDIIGNNIEDSDFIFVDYPEEYPPALYIEKMIETANFMYLANVNSTVDSMFRELVTKYVLTPKKNKLPPSSRKFTPVEMQSFVVHPLPFHVSSYYLDFGVVHLENEISFELELFFHGPGRALFSAKTTECIPGLTAEFLVPEIEYSKKEFHINNMKPVVNSGTKYMNMKDRELCNVNSSMYNERDNSITKFSRAHSYDLDSNKIHTREKTSRKVVHDYYNKLSHMKEQKDPFVLSELLQSDCSSSTDMMFGLRIKFHPNSEFYDDGMLFEDFLLIDIHMGPSVPLLMRGVLRREENA